MNIEMFNLLFSKLMIENLGTIEDGLKTNDEIGAVLRIHLICEQFLELYICSICNQEKMFWFQEKKDKEEQKITISFDHKLKMAKTLGLPDWGYKIFTNVNTIRNRLAHRVGQQIDQGKFESIQNTVKSDIEPLQIFNVPLEQVGITTYSETGKMSSKLDWDECSTPHQELLMYIYYTLMSLTGYLNPPKSPTAP